MEYCDVDDPRIRAGAIAHMIRLGKNPPVGTTFGFSAQIKTGEAENLDALDLNKAEAVSEKIWCRMTVTQEDLDNAIRLINTQEIVYTEPKRSQMKWNR